MQFFHLDIGLIPAKILKEDKEEYIKALITTREEDNLDIFGDFMSSLMHKNLSSEIDSYLKSIDESEESREEISKGSKKTGKSREKIIALLSENGKLTAAGLASEIGITAKAVEKHLAKLKAEGIIQREGPDKGGTWKVK